MKFFCLVLVLLLLCGCAAAPEPDLSHIAPESLPPAETEIPMEIPTQPAIPPEPSHPLEQILDCLTLEEQVGQLFLIHHPQTDAMEIIETCPPSGFLFFGYDIVGHTPDSLKLQLRNYQDAANIPMVFALDEEGGTVCRVSCYPAFRSSRFPSPRNLYAQGGMEAVLAAEAEKAALLDSLGFQVNLAPVCDIATEPGSFMYSRSLGQGPEITGEFAAGATRIMAQYQISGALKHFPGYGGNADTHTGMARDTRPLEELESRDLIPFQMGIDAGCGAILMSHTVVDAFDSQNPASLSPEVHRYLREEMGFEGVIITDDLNMQAITDLYGPAEAAVLAVLAGNDLLCCSDYEASCNAVLEAVRSGRIPKQMLEEAVLRVLSWKQDLGLIYKYG